MIPCDRDFLRQPVKDPLPQIHITAGKHFLPRNEDAVFLPGNHSGKGCLDAADFLALFNDSGFIDRDSSGKHITKEELIFSCLQNESIGKSGLSGIIEGRKGSFIKAKGDGFGFAGSKQLRLPIGSQHLCRLAQLSLRCSAPEHDCLSACHISGIGYLRRNCICSALPIQCQWLTFKCGIGQAVAKGIQHLILCKGLKITIAYKNIFCIVIEFFTAKAGTAGIIFVVSGNGICQLAAGIDFARQHIRHCIAAFHTALPCDQNGRQLIPVDLCPCHIHDAANIHHNDGMLKCGSRGIQYGSFFIC